MPKRYIVTLTVPDRESLLKLVSSGKESARKLTRARILLKADQADDGPGWIDKRISDAFDVSVPTVERVRKRFVNEGLEAALNNKKRTRHRARKLDGHQEAHLVALACSKPPGGHGRWSLRLLRDRMVELGYVESLSHEAVRQILKKTSSSRG